MLFYLELFECLLIELHFHVGDAQLSVGDAVLLDFLALEGPLKGTLEVLKRLFEFLEFSIADADVVHSGKGVVFVRKFQILKVIRDAFTQVATIVFTHCHTVGTQGHTYFILHGFGKTEITSVKFDGQVERSSTFVDHSEEKWKMGLFLYVLGIDTSFCSDQ